MKNASVSRVPVAAFTIAPVAPAPVADDKARFDQLGNEWGQTKGEIEDGERAIVVGQADDIRAAADAYAAGKTPTDPNKREREAREKQTLRKAQLLALEQALDEAGNRMAVTIVQYRGEWYSALSEARDAATGHYDTAIREAQAALADLAPIRRAIEWLEQFDAEQARVGRQQQFSGGRLRVEDSRGQEHDPNELLTLAAEATTPPVVKQPRKHKTAATA